MIKPVRKAVFPVAGLGTRFLPATKAMPKEMLPIVDKPLIQYAVEEARAAGIEEIIFITGRGKISLEDHFDHSYELESLLESRRKFDVLEELKQLLPESGMRITFTRQGDPLGLGHAVGCAQSIVGDEPFAVLLADDVFKGPSPCLKQMMEAYNETGGNMVAVMEVPDEHTSRYGILTPGSDDGTLVEIKGLIEKPSREEAPSNLAISGRYILQPEVFNHLANGKKGTGGEIQLTDSMTKLIGTQPFHGFRYEGKRFDCGSKTGWLEANIAFALDRDELKEQTIALLKQYS
jgi:UTP--glucose-1-phosphate uridylyltransferase